MPAAGAASRFKFRGERGKQAVVAHRFAQRSPEGRAQPQLRATGAVGLSEKLVCGGDRGLNRVAGLGGATHEAEGRDGTMPGSFAASFGRGNTPTVTCAAHCFAPVRRPELRIHRLVASVSVPLRGIEDGALGRVLAWRKRAGRTQRAGFST